MIGVEKQCAVRRKKIKFSEGWLGINIVFGQKHRHDCQVQDSEQKIPSRQFEPATYGYPL